MLNKEFCLRCRAKGRKLSSKMGREKHAPCLVLFADGKGIVPLRTEPPDECPYYLEQLLENNRDPEGIPDDIRAH